MSIEEIGSKNKKDRREDWLSRADMITEALPYMQRYSGEYVVIKYGGNAMGGSTRGFVDSVLLLHQCGVKVIVVHGGGPEIGELMDKLGLERKFERGMRYSDKSVVDIVEMVLSGRINKRIVSDLVMGGVKAVGISGKDGALAKAKHKEFINNAGEKVDLGYVGEIISIDTFIIEELTSSGMIPVVSPLSYGESGETYNINGDVMAGALAKALRAKRLLMLTDVEGVYDGEGSVLWEVEVDVIEEMIKEDQVSGGMLPKVETCIEAVKGGVDAAVIMDGRHPGKILLELFTDLGGGTIIKGK